MIASLRIASRATGTMILSITPRWWAATSRSSIATQLPPAAGRRDPGYL